MLWSMICRKIFFLNISKEMFSSNIPFYLGPLFYRRNANFESSIRLENKALRGHHVLRDLMLVFSAPHSYQSLFQTLFWLFACISNSERTFWGKKNFKYRMRNITEYIFNMCLNMQHVLENIQTVATFQCFHIHTVYCRVFCELINVLWNVFYFEYYILPYIHLYCSFIMQECLI